MQSKYGHSIRLTGIVIENDKILLVKQKLSNKRKWSLPGGRLEAGESIEQGLLREMKEETNLDVYIVKLLYVCDVVNDDSTLVHMTFLLIRVGGNIDLPSNEYDENPIHDVKFVDIDILYDYGFDEKFINIIKDGFADSGSYKGDKSNIGLGI